MQIDICPKCGSAERTAGVGIVERLPMVAGRDSSGAEDERHTSLDLGWLYPGRVRVFHCRKCGHVEHSRLAAIGFRAISSLPEAPTPDDVVLLKVVVAAVAVTGSVSIPRDGLELLVTVWREGNHRLTNSLRLEPPSGGSAIDLGEGQATIELGKLPEGAHELVVDIDPPQGLEWKVQPPRNCEVLVRRSWPGL